MCRSVAEGGRRCDGREKWCVNRENHERFEADPEEERHWMRPAHLLSMTPNAIKIRNHRAKIYARQVDAVRTVHGVAPNQPIGPVRREELWSHRYRGTQLTLFAMAERFKAIAEEEGISTAEVAARYQKQQIRPHRQSAGERLADLVVDASRPDWVEPDRLVSMIAPAENGDPAPAYCRVVRDLDDREWVLVSSYDGSEPMVWPNDAAGKKAAAWEALERTRAVTAEPASYEAWLDLTDATETPTWAPYTQSMTDNDFLANSGEGGMHLV